MKRSLLFLLLLASPVFAQSGSDFALAVKISPAAASAGALLSFNKAFALRPLLSFSSTNTQRELTITQVNVFNPSGFLSTSTGIYSVSEQRFSGSLEGLFYLSSQQASLQPYLGIEAGYTTISAKTPVITTTTTPIPLPVGETPIPVSIPTQQVATRDGSAGFFSLAGSLGAQFALTKQFSVFGEFSFGYQSGRIIDQNSGNPVDYQRLGLSSSGVGILYFL